MGCGGSEENDEHEVVVTKEEEEQAYADQNRADNYVYVDLFVETKDGDGAKQFVRQPLWYRSDRRKWTHARCPCRCPKGDKALMMAFVDEVVTTFRLHC